MKNKSSQSAGGKKGPAKIITTIIAVIIVGIASLLGFGDNNEEAGSQVESSERIEAESDVNLQTGDNEYLEEESILQEESEVIAEETSGNEVTEEVSEEISEEITEPEITVAEITFRNDNLLDQHYEKHGIEMGFASAEEYELAAYKVIINPDALHKIEAEDGDDVYYVEATNEFVVVSQDGYIRTYFNPSAGIDYYNRQ